MTYLRAACVLSEAIFTDEGFHRRGLGGAVGVLQLGCQSLRSWNSRVTSLPSN